MPYMVFVDTNDLQKWFYALGHWWKTNRYAKECVWCGQRFKQNALELRKTKEHVIPHSMGELRTDNWYPNITASHRICNNTRKNDVSWVPYYAGEESMPAEQREWVDNFQMELYYE